MRAKLRVAAITSTGLLAISSPFWGPRLLREIPWFTVQQVEISGTRLLAPHEVLAASAIRAGRNVWDDTKALETAIASHPTVAAVEVSRKMPGTLRIRVEEKRPLAYVELETLSPITADGEVLPVNPARVRLDLPVVRGEWRSAKAAYRTRILAEIERLSITDPALFARVSEIRADGDALGSLVLVHAVGEIVIPVGSSPARVAELRAVLADLESRIPRVDSAGNPAAPARLDLRYGNQIVVRLPSSSLL